MSGGDHSHHWGSHLLGGLLFIALYLAAQHWSADYLVKWLFALFGAVLLVKALFGMVETFLWQRALGILKLPSGIFGDAFEPDFEDAISFGLFETNPDNQGFLVAAKDNQLLYCNTDSHVTLLGSNGSGKSASGSINIAYSMDTNAIFTGKGTEVYLAARKWRAETFGHEIKHWNPYHLGGLDCDNINLLEDLFPFVEDNNPEALDIAANKALLLIPKSKGGGDNDFFLDFGRSFLGSALNYGVWSEIETGAPHGNLPYLQTQLGGSIEQLKMFLATMSGCDAFEGSIARAADRFLSLLKASPKTALSVLGVISNALSSFDPASKIGKAIQHSSFDVHDITRKKMTIFFSNAPDKVQNSPAIGLAVEMFTNISLRDQSKNRRILHFVLDEFGNLCGGEIPSIISMLYLGRSLKTRGIFFVQSTSIFDRYSEPNAFISQSACFLATAIRDVDDAKLLSERSGQYSAMVENVSLPVPEMGAAQDYSISLNEQAIPNKRSDEILQLKDYTALLFYRQNPPVLVDLVHYQSVKEWRAHVKTNPDIELEELPVKYSLTA